MNWKGPGCGEIYLLLKMAKVREHTDYVCAPLNVESLLSEIQVSWGTAEVHNCSEMLLLGFENEN